MSRTISSTAPKRVRSPTAGVPPNLLGEKLREGHSAVGGRCRIIEVCDRGECGGSVERELAEKTALIRPAALRAWSEHAIEQGEILRACQREQVVAGSERWGRRSAASDPIPDHHQNACRGRERQGLHGFGGGPAARFHPIACHRVLVAKPAREIDVETGGLLERRHVQIENSRGRRDRPALDDQRYQNDDERKAEKHRCVRQPGEDRNDRKKNRDSSPETDP